MPNFTLDQQNRSTLPDLLTQDAWIVACLCAAWCDVCGKYRADFDRLAALHPDATFIWIDIEDHADLVGDLDVENFPTLLLQHDDVVAFYGPVNPDLQIAHRLLLSQRQKSNAELDAEAVSSAERSGWQQSSNLRLLLRKTTGT